MTRAVEPLSGSPIRPFVPAFRHASKKGYRSLRAFENHGRSGLALLMELAPQAVSLSIGKTGCELEVIRGQGHDRCDVLRASHQDDLFASFCRLDQRVEARLGLPDGYRFHAHQDISIVSSDQESHYEDPLLAGRRARIVSVPELEPVDIEALHFPLDPQVKAHEGLSLPLPVPRDAEDVVMPVLQVSRESRP